MPTDSTTRVKAPGPARGVRGPAALLPAAGPPAHREPSPCRMPRSAPGSASRPAASARTEAAAWTSSAATRPSPRWPTPTLGPRR